MKDDLKQYLDLFETEAKEYIQTLNNTLVELEKKPEDQDLLYTVMRVAHTLKSMMATMDFNSLAELCHKMEDFFDAARNNKLVLTKDLTSVLFKCVDILEEGVKKVLADEKEPDTKALVSKLQIILEEKKSSEDLGDKITEKIEGKETEIEEIKDINVSVERLDKLMGLMEELIITKMHLNDIDQKENYAKLKAEVERFERVSEELQYHITQARMVEVGYLFNRFPRMMRDLASKSGKELDLEVEGSEIKLDRNIIDELSEPLVHLLRNAVDHGIEKEGKITLNARREKNSAIIEVSDTGKGIDIEKVKGIALDKGIVSEEELAQMEERKIMELIFDPMLSTKEEVSDVSGRGVGMSAVKQKIEALNGVIRIESTSGEGTKFVLELPLTLAIIKALLVRVKDHIYAIPVNYIDRSVSFEKENIKKAADQKVAILEEDDIPLLDLKDHFGIEDGKKNKDGTLTVIVNKDTDRLGLIVDELIQEEEIIVKSLSSLLKERKEFSGVTVLGDGRSVLILDIQNLI